MRKLSQPSKNFLFTTNLYRFSLGNVPLERYDFVYDLLAEERQCYTSAPTKTHIDDEMEVTLLNIADSFKPLFDMGEDFVESVTPYKAEKYLKLDLMQPIRGAGNLVKGIAYLAWSVIFLPISIPLHVYTLAESSRPIPNPSPFDARHEPSTRTIPFKERLAVAGTVGLLQLTMFSKGLTATVRGATQIVTTPLVLAIKVPVRSILTLVTGGWNRKSIKRHFPDYVSQNVQQNSLNEVLLPEQKEVINLLLHRMMRPLSSGGASMSANEAARHLCRLITGDGLDTVDYLLPEYARGRSADFFRNIHTAHIFSWLRNYVRQQVECYRPKIAEEYFSPRSRPTRQTYSGYDHDAVPPYGGRHHGASAEPRIFQSCSNKITQSSYPISGIYHYRITFYYQAFLTSDAIQRRLAADKSMDQAKVKLMKQNIASINWTFDELKCLKKAVLRVHHARAQYSHDANVDKTKEQRLTVEFLTAMDDLKPPRSLENALPPSHVDASDYVPPAEESAAHLGI